MTKRLYDICNGIDVTPDIADRYRKLWAAQSSQSHARKKVLFKTFLSPGDIMTLTAAIESIHIQFPNEFLTGVATSQQEIFSNNPHIVPLFEYDDDVKVIDVHYDSINVSNQTSAQFIRGYTDFISKELQIPLTLQVNRPYVYLSDEEKATRLIPGDYAIINAGVKDCYTCKQWPIEYYQEVVNRTRNVQWAQVGESHPQHFHPKLTGVVDLIGKTTIREFLSLVANCRGAIGPVTFLMHSCAAFEKQYICLNGGREPVAWVQYPKQQTLHTIGMLDCCQDNACWKSRVIPLGDDNDDPKYVCRYPITTGLAPYGKCMSLITPDDVTSIIRKSNW
jgi:ADP-heptose:LPS heptosyltransferase